MPKNRNRTVINTFEFPPEFLRTLPQPEKINVNGQKLHISAGSKFGLREPNPTQPEKKYCQQNDPKTRRSHSSSSSDYNNITSDVSDIDIISFGKSSSSSISWSDDFDTEATQRVQNEFERMERVLQGKEAIPAHYNHDEYEQWIKAFPQLSISGKKMKYPIQQMHPCSTPRDSFEEIIAFDSDLRYLVGNCDRESNSADIKKINNIKNAVIDKVFQSISSKILDKKIKHKSNIINVPKNGMRLEEKVEYVDKNNIQNLTTQFDSFLRISPFLSQKSTSGSNYLDTRQHSSNSVSRSDKLASKWMKEDEPIEYSSLPYLSTSAKTIKTHKVVRRKNSTSSKSKYSSKLSPNKNNYVSLPPIKNLSLPSTNQYRSISATPRQPIKGSSAASTQADSILGKNKSGIEVTNYLSQNGLQPRKNIVKHRK